MNDERSAALQSWQVVHGELVGIAKRRAGLDAEEARWLREAEELQIWKPFGMVSMVDYLERILGYEPRSGQHRMRVARELGNLPEMTEALSTGELCFSAIRELVRVATPATEGAWRDAAGDKNLREIEQLVAGHKPGDLPDDPVEPGAVLHDVMFREVTASVFASFRQARLILQTEHGSRMTDSEVLASLASRVLDGAVGSEVTGRARCQLGYVVCRVCDRAWQNGAGVQVPITAAELEKARCDAQHIGALDGEGQERAVQDIPPAVARFVHARDGGVCQTPGCRSAHGLEIHHIVPRSAGGSHDASNLTLRCGSCHAAHHDGRLCISGVAPDAVITERRVDARRAAQVAVASTAPVPLPSLPVVTDEASESSDVNLGDEHAVESKAPSHATQRHASRPTQADLRKEPARPRDRAAAITDDAVALPSMDLLGANGSAAKLPPLDRNGRSSPAATRTSAPLSPRYEAAVVREEAFQGLRTLGFTAEISRGAVSTAMRALPPGAPLESVLIAALRECPKPRGVTTSQPES